MLAYSPNHKICGEATQCPFVPENLPDHPLEIFEIQSLFSLSRWDSEERIFFHMRAPDFCAFSSASQFLQFSSDRPNVPDRFGDIFSWHNDLRIPAKVSRSAL
jgi:hypothetical protein